MNSITELLSTNGKVWFFIGNNKELKKEFSSALVSSGIEIKCIPDTLPDALGNFVSVSRDGTIRNVSIIAWNAAFEPGRVSLSGENLYNIPKVDFGRFRNGDPDYLL